MGRFYDWAMRLFGQPEQTPAGAFVVPNGQAEKTEPCGICGRLPALWEDGFMIYGKPICEDCFEGYDDWEQRLHPPAPPES